jgi:hypothetical protein
MKFVLMTIHVFYEISLKLAGVRPRKAAMLLRVLMRVSKAGHRRYRVSTPVPRIS